MGTIAAEEAAARRAVSASRMPREKKFGDVGEMARVFDETVESAAIPVPEGR
jgi:hypothetical protein